MEEMVYGALGVLATLALLGLGAVLGWWSHEWQRQGRLRSAARASSLRERQRQQADAQAFSLLMGYNADLAYGVTAAGDMLPERDDEGKEV